MPIMQVFTASGDFVLNTKDEAFKFFDEMNAPKHLKDHVRLVGEAGDLLILKLEELNCSIDSELIDIGYHKCRKANYIYDVQVLYSWPSF